MRQEPVGSAGRFDPAASEVGVELARVQQECDREIGRSLGRFNPAISVILLPWQCQTQRNWARVKITSIAPAKGREKLEMLEDWWRI